ncbi:MAG TPA: S24 family peptidase [Hyphomicrobiales bacterium]|nr:S24 family peptidase [Hyphomicrobiales bacterium]
MPRTRGGQSEYCFTAEVTDSANVPELKPMDIVTVDPHAELEDGDFVYIEVRQKKTSQRTFRRYFNYGSTVRLAPLNRNYRTYLFGAPGEPRLAILGKVVELSRSYALPTVNSSAIMAALSRA